MLQTGLGDAFPHMFLMAFPTHFLMYLLMHFHKQKSDAFTDAFRDLVGLGFGGFPQR